VPLESEESHEAGERTKMDISLGKDRLKGGSTKNRAGAMEDSFPGIHPTRGISRLLGPISLGQMIHMGKKLVFKKEW